MRAPFSFRECDLMKIREATPLAEGVASLALYEEIRCCLSKKSPPSSSAAQKGMIEVQAEKGVPLKKNRTIGLWRIVLRGEGQGGNSGRLKKSGLLRPVSGRRLVRLPFGQADGHLRGR